ncbi:hypothetical protein PR048_008456 [Dryococelus australis]|uniref:CCHC-type domain-containing protein n=1 Tax=Dryococelus australis TaxID=614101 RepID=A0ABQ9HX59_9NEOP|nr:hypothetical protein PR048_008456 [Dryococelus australis]
MDPVRCEQCFRTGHVTSDCQVPEYKFCKRLGHSEATEFERERPFSKPRRGADKEIKFGDYKLSAPVHLIRAHSGLFLEVLLQNVSCKLLVDTGASGYPISGFRTKFRTVHKYSESVKFGWLCGSRSLVWLNNLQT